MIFALLNIATDITLNIAWWTTKTVIGGLYSTTTNLLGNNLLRKGCTKNNMPKEYNNNEERITILMDKIDILLENNLLDKDCAKTNN